MSSRRRSNRYFELNSVLPVRFLSRILHVPLLPNHSGRRRRDRNMARFTSFAALAAVENLSGAQRITLCARIRAEAVGNVIRQLGIWFGRHTSERSVDQENPRTTC